MSDDVCRCGHAWKNHTPDCETCGCTAVQRFVSGGCKYCDVIIKDFTDEAKELHEIKHLIEVMVLRKGK